MATQPDLNSNDGWIEHDGSECPLDAETAFDIRYRDGAETFNNAPARLKVVRDRLWEHDGGSDDIIAYRVVSA